MSVTLRYLVVRAACLGLGASLLLGTLALAQTETADARANTERELRALEEQIAQFEQRLDRARRNERSEIKKLSDLERQIKVRERLLTTYRRRNRQLNAERSEALQTIEGLQADLGTLESQYRGLVRHAYKHGRLKYLSLLLSSQSLTQMLVRAQYLRRFAEQRELKRAQIQTKAAVLEAQQRQLQATIDRNNELANKDRDEQQKLARLRTQRSTVVRDLRAQRSAIEQELAEKRRNGQRLREQLRAFIEAESRRAAELRSTAPDIAEEFTALAASFSKNKGSLPWPVTGVVTEGFGTRVHPVYKTRTQNPGIEITTSPRSAVRAVFDGIVSQEFVMPGYGQCIMVWHGDYTTVYGNFSSLAVKQGDRLQAGQLVGYAGTDAQPKGPAVFFALFTPDGKEIDPEPWLRNQ